MSKVIFIIPPKVHLLDITGPTQIFYEARMYGADVEMHFANLSDNSEIESSAGLHFSKLEPFQNFSLSKNDYVFVPGLEYELISNVRFVQSCKSFFTWLNQQYANGANVCSVCTGAFLLAESGLLNDKSCTTHWKFVKRFQQRYPTIDLKKERLFVDNDHLYTSAGVASGIDLALYLLEVQYGGKFAADIAREVVIYFRRSKTDKQLSVFLQYKNHMEERVHSAQDYMIANIQNSFTIEEIAETVNMSPRNLTRLFKKTTGITIGAYLEKLRVERAVHLLAEQNKVDFVADQCGLKSSNQLRTLLKRHKDVLPTEI
ncbi:MAG: AraC family transcriptional regulator [Thalassobius sp.]|nr:AraC family transcriptional regulator [Thalassovita sp.]